MSEQFTVFYPMPEEGVANYFIENGSGISAKVEGPRNSERDRFVSDLLKPNKYHDRLVEALGKALARMESDLEQIEGEWEMGADLESLEKTGGLTDEIIEARALLVGLEAEKGGEL